MISGFGRSGSTLLGRMLGQIKGAFYLGEFQHIWKRQFERNVLCECRKKFKECPIWSEIIKRAFGDVERLDLPRIRRDKHLAHKYWDKPAILRDLIMPLRGRLADARHGSRMESILRHSREVTGTELLIDASKVPAHGHVLENIASVDLRVVHLVRDPRGVAFSWQKKKPILDGSQKMIIRYSASRSAKLWLRVNRHAEKLGQRLRGKYYRLRYEHLLDDPQDAINETLEGIGLGDTKTPEIRDGVIDLSTGHSIGGNPDRFKSGPTELRLDSEWQEKLDPCDRQTVERIAGDMMRKYGYL